MLKYFLFFIFIINLDLYCNSKFFQENTNNFLNDNNLIAKTFLFTSFGLSYLKDDKTRLINTSFKALDSTILSQVLKKALINKKIKNNNSFKNENFSLITSFILPYTFEYKKDLQIVNLLYLFPLYELHKYIKNSPNKDDVILSSLLSYFSAYIAYKNDSSFTLNISKRKTIIKYSFRF